MNRDLRIYRELKRRGKRAEDLTSAEMRALVASVMTPAELATTGGEIVATEYRVRVAGRRVSLPVFDTRKQGCGSNVCGLFKVTADGQPFCAKCGCGGQLLIDKWWDPIRACPNDPPVWPAEPSSSTP